MTDLLNTLVLLGAFQGFGLALALTRRRVDHLASRVLGALVGAVSLMLLLAFAEARWALQGHPGLIAVGSPLPYLFNPLLCLYVLALTRPIERFDPRWLVHALPFLAYLAYMTQAVVETHGWLSTPQIIDALGHLASLGVTATNAPIPPTRSLDEHLDLAQWFMEEVAPHV